MGLTSLQRLNTGLSHFAGVFSKRVRAKSRLFKSRAIIADARVDADVDVEGRQEPRGDRKLRGEESREAGETQSRWSRARVKVIYDDGIQSSTFVS